MTPIRILHLITDLNTGGAEMSLARLVTHLDPQKFDSRVVSMIPLGAVGKQLQEQGIAVNRWKCHRGGPRFRAQENYSELSKSFSQMFFKPGCTMPI